MTLSQRTPVAVRFRVRSSAILRALAAYAVGSYRVILMFVRNPGLLPLALSAPLAYRRRGARPSSQLPPLARVADGIWRVPAMAAQDEPEPEPEPDEEESARCVILHYTGTGESVHAAYENTQHLFAHDARLAHATHYIFEAPLPVGAYYGPDPFSASMWQRVGPIVAHYEGPFVLVGLSRGALVALDHGMRVVEECGKVAAVLSLSAPLDMPRTIPASIRTIADFVDVLARLAEIWPQLLSPVRRALTRIIADIYVMLTALVLRHHGVYDLDALTRNARDLTDHGVVGGALRACREFRLLLRATDSELAHFRQAIARALLRHGERFFATLVWGENDVWIDAEQCRARMLEAARKEAPSVALHSELCAGHGHMLSARDSAAHAAHQACLSHLVDHALRAHTRQAAEFDPTLALRGANYATPEGSDD